MLALSKAIDIGCVVAFQKDSMTLTLSYPDCFEKNGKQIDDTVIYASREGGLFAVSFDPFYKASEPCALTSVQSTDKDDQTKPHGPSKNEILVMELHEKHGHMRINLLKLRVKEGSIATSDEL